jgi:hypothetical protein
VSADVVGSNPDADLPDEAVHPYGNQTSVALTAVRGVLTVVERTITLLAGNLGPSHPEADHMLEVLRDTARRLERYRRTVPAKGKQ